MTNNAPEEETNHNSKTESKDAYIEATCEETFGKECHEETYNKGKTSGKETSSN